MTLLEHELAKLPNETLRAMARSATPTVAAAAQAELDDRPAEAATEIEALRRDVFPPNPTR